MANEIAINIGSFGLNDGTNHIAIEDINFQLAKSLSISDLPKFHGSVIPIAKRKSMSVRVRGSITGTEYDNLRSNLDALKNSLESAAEQNLTLDDDRYMAVQYRGFSYAYKTLRTFADFSFELVASDPFWYSQTLQADTRSPASGSGYTIANAGNAPTRVKITMTNNSGGAIANDIQLENQTAAETLNYRGSLANTKVLIVNNRVGATDLAVTNDGSDDIVNMEGDFLTLNPGNNTIVFTCAGAPNVSVKLEWRDAWY